MKSMYLDSRKEYVDEEEKIEKKVEGETVMIGRKYKLPEVIFTSTLKMVKTQNYYLPVGKRYCEDQDYKRCSCKDNYGWR